MTLVVSCLKVAFLGTVNSSLILLVSAKTHYLNFFLVLRTAWDTESWGKRLQISQLKWSPVSIHQELKTDMQIHIFYLSSWARWNRPVLAKISSFSLKTSLDRWQLIKWCFTSSLHSDSRTKPLKPRDQPKFFPSLLFKKQSWDIMNVSLMNDFFLYL